MYNQATYKAYDRKKSIHFKGTLIFTIIISVLSILCIFVYDCLTAMPYFQTQDIQIRGHNYLSKSQILECGGLMPGDNIIDLNISQINKRLVQNPWIASASTYRQFPNALHIEITEKKPLAILMIAPPVIIDTYGRVIKKQTSSDPDHLPVVTGITYADISQSGAPLSQKMISIIHVLSEKKQTLGLPQNLTVTQVHVDMDFGITIWLHQAHSEMEILLGSDNYRKKFYRLRKLLTFFRYRKAFQQIDYIDMNNLDRIIVRPLVKNNSDGKEV